MPIIDRQAARAAVRKLVEEVVRPDADRFDRDGTFRRENLQALARDWLGKSLVGLPLEMFEAGGE
jgi:alkylation response protein AidB-like acyl-CoA dehydrogenase